jgi:hypothetical protein
MTRLWVRRGMAVAVACLLLITVGSRPGYPQAKETPEPPRGPDIEIAPPGVRVPAPAGPQPPSVDQLIAMLEDLKRQREDLDKQEKAVAEQLRERLKEQQERLARLGLNPPKPALTPKVGVPDIEFVPPPTVPAAPK